MGKNKEKGRLFDDEQGVVSEHSSLEEETYRVAPSSAQDNKYNVTRIEAVPWACWKIEDICFSFDSALVLYEAKQPFSELRRLWKKETERYKPPCISLFGHADPVGKDEYNKKLSEDRAKAVYGVLRRQVSLWKEIFNRKSEIQDLQELLGTFGHDIKGEYGTFGPKTEAATLQYMEDLCPDFKLEKKDFICDGQKPFQGCSEFNPLRVFSEQQKIELGKSENHVERNDENQPNRRVIAFLWHADEKINPKHWPCPTASDGIAGCKARFWSKGEGDKRRNCQKDGRQWDPDPRSKGGVFSSASSRWTYKKTRKTFACRFYHRMAMFSPCEFAKTALRHQKWEITLKAFDVLDLDKTEENKEDCLILRKKYPPKHRYRKYLHLDFGIRAEYKLRFEFIIAQTKTGKWECHVGVIKEASVIGIPIVHSAFREYYATHKAHPNSTVYWKALRYRVELKNRARVSRLLNRDDVDLKFPDEYDVKRFYAPYKEKGFKGEDVYHVPRIVSFWRRQTGQAKLRSEGLSFDYADWRYSIRPGQKTDDYLKYKHIRVKLPTSFPSCMMIVRNKVTSEVVLEKDTRIHRFIDDLDHLLPLKDGARLIFYHFSTETEHEPTFRDEPFYKFVYDYSLRRMPNT